MTRRLRHRYGHARMGLGPGIVDDVATASLARQKLRAARGGDLTSAVVAAAHFAKKTGHTAYAYMGNSFGHSVWRATGNLSDALNPINNTGSRIVSVEPDLTVKVHVVDRAVRT